ncbi:PAAR domain-containing protein [Pseudomonas gingeri]|uniref:PAAR domain-containing protein n=1 Tax=Pseudomonas gingeri TaxID=117681 RepID=UPI002115FE05|nr:PAAR domain-containing protein [Pseudomonas gingeri]
MVLASFRARYRFVALVWIVKGTGNSRLTPTHVGFPGCKCRNRRPAPCAGGTVITGWERARIEGKLVSREGDRVLCPACGGEGYIVCDGPHLKERFEGRLTALEGDLCRFSPRYAS